MENCLNKIKENQNKKTKNYRMTQSLTKDPTKERAPLKRH